MKFIDTHCHVHFQAFKDDMDEVVERSLKNGVGMITVGTQSTTSKNGLALAERYDGVWCTIGLHPNHLHAQEFADDNELSPSDPQHTHGVKIKTRAEHFDAAYYGELVKHPKVVAIGEFGLDYFRVPPGVDLETLKAEQSLAVREQMRFATQSSKPIVIHCRDAHADQFQLLKDEIDNGGLKRRGVIHCFTGSAEEAAKYREIGFYVSITGIVTFGKNVMAAVKEIPLEQILVETDSPYLSPAPMRGKRNEPSNVVHVAETIAKLKGVSVDEVARVTTENAMRLFGL
ncbi:MAG: TatD family hydrolase [Patescibacteria group bacterium]|jgi:TatD DNase family protein